MTQTTLPSRKRLQKKNCYKATVNIRDLIKFYHKHYGTPSKGGCKAKQFRAIIHEFNEFVAEQLLKGDRVILPYDMGNIWVGKKQQKYIVKEGKLDTGSLLVDWPKTWEYWKTNEKAASEKKLLYYTNEHSDNYRYTFKWDRFGRNVRNIRMYSFKPSRLLSRKLAERIMDEEAEKSYQVVC